MFGIQSFVLKVLALLLAGFLILCLFGCQVTMVDRGTTNTSTYSGANQAITQAAPTTKSWEETLKENGLTLSLGALSLLLLYAYLNQRGAFKGVVKGVERFKDQVDPETEKKLDWSLLADTTPRSRKLIKKFKP